MNREGDVGDLAGGGSYGPFQLYAQGALPARFRGQPRLADQWAWSPQGISYALNQMQRVGAGGLRGPRAVEHIIRRFERPFDPDKSVRLALGRLGTSRLPASRFGIEGGRAGGVESGSVVGDLVNRIPPPAPTSSKRDLLLAALSRGDDLLSVIPKLQARAAGVEPAGIGFGDRTAPTRSPDANRVPVPLPGGRPISLEELIYKNQGLQWTGKGFSPFAATGHDTHTHAAFRDPQSALRAITLAQKLGLAVRENPYVDPVDPVHTKRSWHYQLFPGLYGGKRLGRAIDVSGNAAALGNYFRLLRGSR